MKINSIVLCGLLIAGVMPPIIVMAQHNDIQRIQTVSSTTLRASSAWVKRLCQKEGDPCQETFMAVCPGDKFARHIVFKGTCDEKLKCINQKGNCPSTTQKE